MAASQADVVGLYLAYFGRPPDPGGVAFYVNDTSFDIWSVAAAFSASTESRNLYGPDFGFAQINAIYQNLFNRDAETDGLNYWYGEVTAGRLTPAGAAYAIYLGAQNADKVAVQNKLAVSLEFLAAIDTQAEISGYSGDIAAARARAFIHTVDSNPTTIATAEALLASQVAYATGLITLTFTATKGAGNIVSFTNAGTNITVADSSGSLVFTSSSGGSATVSAGVEGIVVPAGVTLTISSALASGIDFTGTGTALVVASAAGEDLSTTVTGTGIDVLQLTSAHDYTLTTSQLAIARIGTGGTLGNITDAGKMTVIGTLDEVIANQTTLRADGADVVVGTVAAGANIAGKSLTGIDRIDLAAGSFTMTDEQAAFIGLAPGAQTVKLGNSASSNITLAAAVENWQLSDFTGNEVTMGAVGQVVTGGTAADTLTPITGVTSTSDLKAGANVIMVADGTNIGAGKFNATGGTIEYIVDDARTATMSKAQVDLISSADGTQNITLADAVTSYALRTDIETFTLGNFTNSVVLANVDQAVTGGTGNDTVTTMSGVKSTIDLKGGTNVVVVADGADMTKGTFLATGGTFTFNLNGISTAKFTSAEAAHIGTGTGAQTVTISNAATALDLAASVETFVLGNFTNSVTLGAAAQIVTGGTGADTVSTDDLAASGTLAGGGGADVLVTAGTLGAATVSSFETLSVADDSDVSAANAGAALGAGTLLMAASVDLAMTVAQNEGLKTSATVSGTGQSVTLTDAGTATAIAGVETYVLAAGTNQVTTSSGGLTIDADAGADGDVLTLLGSHNVAVTLTAGDLDASGDTGGVTVTATTGTNVIDTGSGTDTIGAGSGDDTIDAGGGNDTVTGGAGADTITLGIGNDFVVFDSMTGFDTVTDFSASADKIRLSKAVFTALGSAGTLAAGAFEHGAGLSAATASSTRIIYDESSGDLYYDADGSGSGSAAVHIATLTGTPTLANTHFIIIA